MGRIKEFIGSRKEKDVEEQISRKLWSLPEKDRKA